MSRGGLIPPRMYSLCNVFIVVKNYMTILNCIQILQWVDGMGSKDLLSVLAGSGIRRDILLHLSRGPISRSELSSRIDVTSPQLSSSIKELTAHDLIQADGRQYCLTPWGRIIVSQFKTLVHTIDLYEGHKDFWKYRTLSFLPDELFNRIGEIGNCWITEDTTINPDETLKEIARVVNDAEYLYGVSSLYMDELVNIFSGQMGKKTKFTIAITESIYTKTISVHPDMVSAVKHMLDIDLYVIKDGNIPCVIVTDKHLILSPFFEQGKVALRSNLVSSDASALRWGKDLIAYYLENARKL